MNSARFRWLRTMSLVGSTDWAFEAVPISAGKPPMHIHPQDLVHEDCFHLDHAQSLRTRGFYRGVAIPDLSTLQPLLKTDSLVRALAGKAAVPNRHTIFRFDSEDTTFLIPAFFFINRLFLRRGPFAKYLYQPGRLESQLHAEHFDSPNSTRVVLGRGIRLVGLGDESLRFLAWVGSSRDARNAWHSVGAAASGREISIRLPNVSLRGFVGGIETPAGLMVGWGRDVSIRGPLSDARISLDKKNRVVDVGEPGIAQQAASRRL